MAFYDHFSDKEVSGIGEKIEHWQNNEFYKIINQFTPLNKDKKLLEIGVGTGLFADVCMQNNIGYLGIEGSPKLSKQLKENGYNIISAFVPPFPEETANDFDIVYMAHVLEHMNDVNMAQDLIKASYNSLKEDGIIVIICPNYLNYKYEFFNCDYTHNYVTTTRRVIQLLENSNFKILYNNYFSGPFFGKKRYPLKFLNHFYNWKLFNLFFGSFVHKDFFYKAKLTFSENLIILGQK